LESGVWLLSPLRLLDCSLCKSSLLRFAHPVGSEILYAIAFAVLGAVVVVLFSFAFLVSVVAVSAAAAVVGVAF